MGRNGHLAVWIIPAILIAALLVIPGPAHAKGATDSDFGIGLILGNPSGLTGKWWIQDPHSLTFDLAFQWWSPGPRADVNYEYNFEDFLKDVEDSPCTLRLSFGGGVAVGWTRVYRVYPYLDEPPGHDKDDDDDEYMDDYYLVLAGRAPLSLSARFREYPFEPFFMIAPVVGFTPQPHFGWDSGLGIRFYF